MEYQLDKWKRQDWHKGNRHYSCEIRQNLLMGRAAPVGTGEHKAGTVAGASVRPLRGELAGS